jgi:hypothetical protein
MLIASGFRWLITGIPTRKASWSPNETTIIERSSRWPILLGENGRSAPRYCGTELFIVGRWATEPEDIRFWNVRGEDKAGRSSRLGEFGWTTGCLLHEVLGTDQVACAGNVDRSPIFAADRCLVVWNLNLGNLREWAGTLSGNIQFGKFRGYLLGHLLFLASKARRAAWNPNAVNWGHAGNRQSASQDLLGRCVEPSAGLWSDPPQSQKVLRSWETSQQSSIQTPIEENHNSRWNV